MSSFTINPGNAMGGVIGGSRAYTLAELVSSERSIQTKWVERLRTAVDFITPDNTLLCVTNSPFFEQVTELTPLGLTQSFNENEGLAGTLAPEVGSRRKRAIIGSSQGGSIGIARMECMGPSPLSILTKYNKTKGIDTGYWPETEWTALASLNHDKAQTSAIGLVVVRGTPDGRNYAVDMYEQCVLQGTSTAYQSGQHIVVINISLIYEQKRPMWSVDSTGLPDYTTGI